jgi:hypothetical protein
LATKLTVNVCTQWQKISNGKKPYLANIQEFSAAVYVKDLTAGKWNTHAQKGRLVGYDSEGY